MPNHLQVVEPNHPVALHRHVVDCSRPGGGATNVERAHRQLGPGLADGLCGDDADRLADVHRLSPGKVPPVARTAHAEPRLAGNRRSYADLVDAEMLEPIDPPLVEQGSTFDGNSGAARVRQVLRHHPPEHTLAQRLDDVTAFDERVEHQAVVRAAVLLGHHEVLCNVDQTSREITGIGGLQRRVRQALAGAVRGDEVLEDVQTFPEVGGDRRLDDRSVRLGHQATHPGELPNLGRGATCPRVGHHVDRVERLLLDAVSVLVQNVFRAEHVHHRLGDLLVGVRPDVDDLVVALALSHETGRILLLDLLDRLLRRTEDRLLPARDHHVLHADGDTGARRIAEARVHELIGEHDRLLQPHSAVAGVDQRGDRLLVHQAIHEVEREPRRHDLGQQRAACRRVAQLHPLHRLAVIGEHDIANTRLDPGVQVDHSALERPVDLRDVGEHHPGALRIHPLARHVVQTEHHVLRRHDDRLTVRRGQDVVGRHHQRPRLELGLDGQRDVHRHLVAVEVRVERRAHQWMKLYRLAFDKHGLERLDAEAVKGGRAVEEHRVFANHLLQDVPDLGTLPLDQPLRGLDRRGETAKLKLSEDERLEQLQRHLLRQSALVQLQGRTDDHDRTPRVVDPLAQKVLPEPALFPLDHVGQRLQRPLVRPGDRATAAPVVEQGVHRFLQHALLVAHDDVGRVECEQPLETIVAIDDPPIEIVQVRRREATTVQRHQRPQLRRKHRQHLHHHPFGLVSGARERLHQLEALRQLLDLRFRTGLRQFLAQHRDFFFEIDGAQQLVDRLRTHLRFEIVAVLLERVEIHLVGEKLTPLQIRHARIAHDECFEVENALDVAQRHVEQQPHARGQGLQVPDVGDGTRQLDMPHALPANLRQGDLDPALLADDATVLQALVLAAQALVVLDRPENLRAEQTVPLRLERTVVDGLRLLHFTIGPGPDLVRRCESDPNRIEPFHLTLLSQKIE